MEEQLSLRASALGFQHLDMLNLRGRNTERIGRDRKTGLDEEFDFGAVEKAEEGYGGSKQRNEPEQTKQRGGKAKKGRTQTWSNVVEGLKKEDELEVANSHKSWNGSETTNWVEQFNLNCCRFRVRANDSNMKMTMVDLRIRIGRLMMTLWNNDDIDERCGVGVQCKEERERERDDKREIEREVLPPSFIPHKGLNRYKRGYIRRGAFLP